MTPAFRTALLAAASLAGISAMAASAQPPKLPVVAGRETVAVVNGESITLEALRRTMDEIAADIAKGEGKPQDPMTVLDRFVTAKLIAQEARASGLDDDPSLKRGVEAFRRDTLRRLVLESPARKIQKADPKETKRLLRIAKGQGRISSLLFAKREDAHEFVEKVKAGADFDEEAEGFVKAGRGIGHVPNGWVPMTDLRGEVAGIAAQLEPGQATAPIKVKEGFTCVKVFEWRVPEDAATLEQAEDEALTQQRLIAVGKFTEDIKARYAKIDDKLVEALDFEAPEPGFEAMKADRRVLVTVKGADNITVGDLARALAGRFFHGMKRAAERKQINRLKWPALDDIIVRRVAVLEGKRLGLDKSADFAAQVEEYEESQLFNLYVQKVIRPDVVTDDEQVKEYFDQRRDDFKGPETVRLDQIAFAKRDEAEKAMARLRGGADFEWARKNSPSTIPAGDERARLDVRGREFTREDLPEAARDAIADAAKGDLRIYDEPEEGVTYILRVLEIVPPARLDWEIARESVRRALVQKKIRETVDDVVGKLKAAGEVKLHVSEATIGAALAGAPKAKR